MNVNLPRAPAIEMSWMSGRGLVIAACCILFLVAWFALGDRILLNPDEGRYAEIPREMVASGDWITPHLNDLKYFEKPPLQYWATAIAYEAFGTNEFSSRLWCVFTGFCCIALVGWLGLRLFDRRVGMLAAILLASSWMYVVMGHVNTLDMGLSFFLTATVGAFLFAQQCPTDSSSQRNWMLTAWAAAALAFLTKGLVALVLPSLTLSAYSVVTQNWSIWRRLHLRFGIVVFVAISAPWFIAVSSSNSGFLEFFFFHEHFQRFFTQIHARVQPWWFFLAVVTVGSLPWTSLLPAALVRTWRSTRADRVPSIQLYPLLFLAIWAIVIVIFFSFSQSKLAPYILPAMPALALLTAKYVAESSPRKILPHFVGVAVLYATLFAVACFIDPPHNQHFSVAESASLLHFARTAFGIALLGALTGVALLYRDQLMFALLAVGATSFLCIAALLIGADDLSELRSGYDLALIVGPYVKLNKPIYSLSHYDQSLTFYLRHPVKLVGYRGELDFGLNQEPTKWIGSEAEFERQWTGDTSGSVALLPRGVYAHLATKGVAMTVIGGESDEVVVTKP